eukprot:Skav230554  [mRNA]  locus=scaffold4799:35612:35821:+ [translate_table: standard]
MPLTLRDRRSSPPTRASERRVRLVQAHRFGSQKPRALVAQGTRDLSEASEAESLETTVTGQASKAGDRC